MPDLVSKPDSGLPVAITQGDAAGIGPEIIAQAFATAPTELRGCFVVGDVATMRRATRIAAAKAPPLPLVLLSQPQQVWHCPPHCLPLLPLAGVDAAQAPPALGQLSARAGHMAAQAVVWAAQAALRGQIAALVTAPLNKAALSLAGPPYDAYPGHTELLQAEAAAHLGLELAQCPVRMMLANDELRVLLLSIHLPLQQALAAVTFDNVLQSLLIAHRALQPVLGRAPRIGVAGLNPHAGEGGLFGREEQDIIAPAVAAARLQGIDASAPQAPDTIFMRARAKDGQAGEFDIVLAMYHDQGLIPIKYLGLDQGVNVTLGLPLVRTSPDHGTAFDLAGSGSARADSLLAALRMARQMVAINP